MNHFSLWARVTHASLAAVAGASGDAPTCSGTGPSWLQRVYWTATDDLGMVLSCVGGSNDGPLVVNVRPHHGAWIYVDFNERPSLVRYVTDIGIQITMPPSVIFSHGADWRLYVPPSLTLEASFSRPRGTIEKPVVTTLQGAGGRDGVTYVGDVVVKAMQEIVGAVVDAAPLAARALVACANDFIDVATLSLQPSIDYDSVTNCFFDQIKAGFLSDASSGVYDKWDASAVASKLSVLRKAAMWLKVAEYAHDALDLYLDKNNAPAVVTAALLVAPQLHPALVLSTAATTPAASVRVDGSGFTPAETVDLAFDGETLGSASADQSGTFMTTVVIPSGAPSGAYDVTGTGEQSQASASATIHVDRPVGQPRAVAVSAGDGFVCAVTSLATVRCWGENMYGELGDGTTANSAVPVDVTGLSDVTAVTAGGLHACALTGRGDVYCWGDNGRGQLGNGTTTNSAIPVRVETLDGRAVSISAGSSHSCAVTVDGAIFCWGDNDLSQVGDFWYDTLHTTPVLAADLSGGQTAVAAGNDHTCAIAVDGSTACWGYGWWGQLGGGVFEFPSAGDRLVPVTGLATGVGSVSAGEDFTCAVTTLGGAVCWGLGRDGELGDGQGGGGFEWAVASPTQVLGMSADVASVSAGAAYACALKTDASVWCWGNLYGPTGPGGSNTATAIAGLGSATAVSVGWETACAITQDGGVRCWGNNDQGQLGNGVISPYGVETTTPVTVVGFGP